MNTLVTPLPTADVAAGAATSGGVSRFARSLWRALLRIGEARSRRELLELAARHESSQPSFTAELRAAARHTASD